MPKALAWSDILFGIFGFALMTAFWPGISGAATTPRWIVAALLGFSWFGMARAPISLTGTIGCVLLAWLFLSVSWSAGSLDGLDAAVKLSLAGIAFVVGTEIADLRPLFVGAAIGLAISSLVAVLQVLGWHGVPSIDDTPAGLFVNRDRLAAAAALVAIGLVVFRQWALLPLLLPALILGNSRGAWLAIAAGLFVWVKRPLWEKTIVFAGALVAVLVLKGASIVDLASSERLWIWRDTFSGVTFWGHGLGSFRELFPTYLDAFAHSWKMNAEPTRPEHPHNEFLWLLFEGGVPALLLALAFCASCWRACDHPSRAVLVGLLVLAQFAMPLHDPATLILGALVAGFVTGRGALFHRLAYDCRDSLCGSVAAYERGGVDGSDRNRQGALSV